MIRSPLRLALVGAAFLAALALAVPAAQVRQGLKPDDIHQLQSVGDVQLSPDGSRIAYSVQYYDRPGRPYAKVWIKNVAAGADVRLGSDNDPASNPRWSPDGQWIAFFGRENGGSGVVIARPDGSDLVFLAQTSGTNHPLPSSGESLAWSPDSKRIAFVSATPGPETDEANGDPMIITRYLYKPTASEGLTRFNDNRRLHIFVVDLGSQGVRQVTTGRYYEHSIEWSPKGDEIAFISNREPDPDRFFNNDIYSVAVTTGVVRQLTSTKNAEYRPTWSPDGKAIAYLGTKRPLTSSETTMEDTHVWLMNADGSGRREFAGQIDNRQGPPRWTRDGKGLCFTVEERGSTRLYRVPASEGQPEIVAPPSGTPGTVGAWSVARGDTVAFAMSTPGTPAELYLKPAGAAAAPQTALNQPLLKDRAIAGVESLVFKSFDDTDVEAFVTKPLGVADGSKSPLIVMIKGGPHGQQGPAFNQKAQVYAAHGYGVLMVNYRGSTGYGQKFTDAIFKDQDGGEAKDVLAGVDAAIAHYPWIDRNRLGIEGGSYGGQLTNWIITQTDRFKAAIPSAGISNLVSFNYMAYYHDYLAVEFGAFPHEGSLMDLLWERSPLRYAAKVKTPTMFLHGENDNDVPIAEAEQFFIALKDVGVETVMIRYPREGHGLRETGHIVDSINRSIAWYDKHFK
jgi:dipeptidyl aminopeptidase/acylaminoacyl peptidase